MFAILDDISCPYKGPHLAPVAVYSSGPPSLPRVRGWHRPLGPPPPQPSSRDALLFLASLIRLLKVRHRHSSAAAAGAAGATGAALPSPGAGGGDRGGAERAARPLPAARGRRGGASAAWGRRAVPARPRRCGAESRRRRFRGRWTPLCVRWAAAGRARQRGWP